MEILLGEHAGFCYGVNRAVEGSIEKASSSKKIYCLGELVHNRQVVSDLEALGITFIDSLEEATVANSQVIIRAHGVPKEIYEEANEVNLELIDFSCPSVLKVQEIASNYSDNGYFVILTGKPEHPEVIGITSYCDNFYVLENPKEVDKALECFNNSNTNKLLLISQTTFSIEKFDIIHEYIKINISSDVDFIVKNTICNSTEVRQRETEELSKKVDMMIIIGGKNSSNTKKLFEVALQNCKNSICVESKNELDDVNFNGINIVGIMAGASTPHNSINEIVEFLKQKD